MLLGIDEVGRGCWAGPLVAAAVCFDQNNMPKGLKDSKLLSRQKREAMDKIIRQHAKYIGIGWVNSDEIDNIGLTKSVRLAMIRAVKDIPISECRIIIDGNINYLAHLDKTQAIIKADRTISEVSAASIIAKVARDNYMIKLAVKYPQYLFEKHVGYGTNSHRLALIKYGPTDIHRQSFKPIIALHNHSSPVY